MLKKRNVCSTITKEISFNSCHSDVSPRRNLERRAVSIQRRTEDWNGLCLFLGKDPVRKLVKLTLNCFLACSAMWDASYASVELGKFRGE